MVDPVVLQGRIKRRVSRALALAFMAAAEWRYDQLRANGRAVLEADPDWLRLVVRRVMRLFPARPLGQEKALVEAIRSHPIWEDRLWELSGDTVVRWLVPEPEMVPVAGPPAGFPVLPLASHDELGRRLGLDPLALAWFADERGLNEKTERRRLHHYHHLWVRKARGGYRLLEAPKPRLRQIQRWLLDNVLAPLPVSPAAHGFVAGRSVRSFVAPHVGHQVVVRLDLEDFFASVSRARVAAIFRRVGYPEGMASTLSGLCTVATPHVVLRAHPRTDTDLSRRFFTNARLRDRHLPQGAPTSPALSNLAAFPLDRRLTALAASHGATMTRYADDLAFAGDAAFARRLPSLLAQVEVIAADEGFRVNRAKTRIMPRGGPQRLCGLVVNDTTNLPRAEHDNLRALLFNAVRFGPETQNRQAMPHFRQHLQGRVAWAASVNPVRGRRLWALFDAIAWDGERGG